eukprot:5887524-Pleurochrysis_carterae.AAC.1
MERWCDKYMRTRCAAAMSSSVGQLIARQSMPTARATRRRAIGRKHATARQSLSMLLSAAHAPRAWAMFQRPAN